MRFLKVALPFLIVLLCVVLDQMIKQIILDYFQSVSAPIDIASFFNIILVWNKGISFSFLSSDNPYMPLWLAGFSIFVGLLLLIWLVREKKLLIKCGLAFVIAGAIGNAIDRLRFGAVVDFLHFYYDQWHFPAFNIADICINIGVGLILIDVLFFSGRKPTKE